MHRKTELESGIRLSTGKNRRCLLESDLVLIPIHTGIEATADNPNPPPGHWSLAVSIKRAIEY